MAIAFDAATDGVSSASFSHTTSGSNRLLVAWVRGGVGEADNKTATYNSISMTKLGYAVIPTDRSLTAFYQINPSLGANTLTFSGGTINRTAAASYNGVSSTVGLDAFAIRTVTGATSFSASVLTVSDNDWLIGSMSSLNQVNSAGANTTKRIDSNSTDSVDTNAPQTPPGTYSMTITTGSSDNFAAIIGAFAPQAGGAATLTTRKTLLGVGI